MADIESRREARRRKILENAENRIRKITNLPLKTEEESNLTVRETFSSNDKLHGKHVILDNSERISTIFKELNSYSNVQNVDEYDDDVQDSNNALENTKLVNHHQRQRNHMWMVFIIAFLLRLLLLACEELSAYSENIKLLHKIFMPLLLYEIFEIFFFGINYSDSPNALNVILTLSNISPTHTSKILYVLQIISKLLQDVSIYFYTFVITDYILNFILVKW